MCLQFANVEEDYADNAVWSMNLLARGIGANYVQAGLWRGFAARQQPGDWAQNFSPAETTAKLVEVLGQ
jgi:hypothetical protein